MRTVGVEEELMLFSARGDQAAPAGAVLAESRSDVEHEFKLEQAEIASDPVRELGELAEQLRARRRRLIESAEQRGVLVAATAASPLITAPTETPDERYHRMHEQFGLVAGDQLTCGAHVHVSVESRSEGVAVIDRVRPWLALLLAMSANSPFWLGLDSGYASYRHVAWGRWPTAGPTETFGDEASYDRTVEDLIAAGAAIDAGMIYFDVRLSANFPTVEFRIADVGQEITDSLLLAALCRAAVDTALSGPEVDVPIGLLRAAAWRAARYGLGGELLDLAECRPRPAGQLIDRLLEELGPALRRTGDENPVRGWVDRLWKRGTGADLQRADRARRGRAEDVVHAAAARTASAVAPVD